MAIYIQSEHFGTTHNKPSYRWQKAAAETLHMAAVAVQVRGERYVSKETMKILMAVILLLPLYVIAHEDTIIERDGDVLLGLPEQYEPASFNEKSLVLKLGKRSVEFPKCIRELLAIKDKQTIVIEASWYHAPEPQGLPPYIAIRTSASLYDYGKSLLLNMDTLYPIDTGFSYGEKVKEKECIRKFKPINKR